MATFTRAIRMFHSVHGTSLAIRRGEKSMEDVARAAVFTPQYFPAFLGVSCLVSGVAGYQFMESLKRQVPAVEVALMRGQ